MDENNPRNELHDADQRRRSEYSPRTWRGCCLAPTIALGLILIIAAVAGLNTRSSFLNNRPSKTPDRKVVFQSFGKSYFYIASRADFETGRAFKELRAYADGKRSMAVVRQAFKRAADANARASTEFSQLTVPDTLASQEKIRHSVDTMAYAYRMRQAVCETVQSWNGKPSDGALLDKYALQTSQVKYLTEEGVGSFAEAAYANGLSSEDIRSLVSSMEIASSTSVTFSQKVKDEVLQKANLVSRNPGGETTVGGL